MVRSFVYVLLWFLLMGVAIFATQNTLNVSLKLLIFQSINLPLGLVLVFSAGLGAFVITLLQGSPTTLPRFTPSRSSTSTASSRSTKTASSSSTKAKPKAQEQDDWENWDEDW